MRYDRVYPFWDRQPRPRSPGAPEKPVNHASSPQVKVDLFRSLFRGREDVYPRRFESRRTGKCGYAPACGNEWVSGICEKPRVKCIDCSHRRFLPVTDEVIRWHLSGQDDYGKIFVMGVYLRDVITRLPATPLSQVEQFLPDVWKTRRKVETPRV